jgi:hypothetical protein
VENRGTSAATTSASICTPPRAASGANRFATAGRAASTTASCSVFQALHAGQRPAHFGVDPPHSLQTYCVRTFATGQSTTCIGTRGATAHSSS